MTARRLASRLAPTAATLLVAACALPFLGASESPGGEAAAPAAGRVFLEPKTRGQVVHGLGQWRSDNLEHIALMDEDHMPAFTTGYVNTGGYRVQSSTDLFVRKFREQLDEEHAAGRFMHLSIEMLDNSTGGYEPIVDAFVARGRFADVVERLAAEVADHGKPVIVRPLFEFNSTKYLDAQTYVAAYRKVVDIFRAAGADDNVAFCWCFEPRAGPRRFMDWYPGDDYVDWFGLDIFGEKDVFTDQQTRSFLREAERHERPVFLAEVTCNRVEIGTTKSEGKRAIREWFEPFADFVDDNEQIKAFAYITTDHRERGRWGEKGWLDARLHTNPTVLEWWMNWVDDKGFVHALGCEPSWAELEGVELE